MKATKSLTYGLRSLWIVALVAVATFLPRPGLAEEITGAQRRAAEEFLAAVASGSPQALAYAIHPAELDEFRLRILEQLRDEAKRGQSTMRSRLFGPGMPLSDIERLTSISFYVTATSRIPFSGRRYQKVGEIGAVPGRDGAMHLVVRGIQPKDNGEVQIVELVTVRPYGKDWKAKIPDKILARVDDIMHGRGAPAPAVTQGVGSGGEPAKAAVVVPPGIIELLDATEKTLVEGNCEEYYKERMSRNFRRVTSKASLEALINACKKNMGTREMLLSTIRIVRDLTPKLEYDGQRAVYDLTGQGLPFNRFVLEQIDKRWYIAE